MEVRDNQVSPVKRESSTEKDIKKGHRPPEFVDSDTKIALVACKDPLSFIQIEKELKNLGYKNSKVATGKELKERFTFFTYPLVVLFQSGPDMDPELRDMLEVLSKFLPEVRRRTFVVYIHLGGNRFDSLQAFSMGCDLTLSPLDLTNLSSILTVEMAEKDKLLKPFFEISKKVEGIS